MVSVILEYIYVAYKSHIPLFRIKLSFHEIILRIVSRLRALLNAVMQFLM